MIRTIHTIQTLFIVIITLSMVGLAGNTAYAHDHDQGGTRITNLIGGYSDQYWSSTQKNGTRIPSTFLPLFTPSPSKNNNLLMNMYFYSYFENQRTQTGATSLEQKVTNSVATLLVGPNGDQAKQNLPFYSPIPIQTSINLFLLYKTKPTTPKLLTTVLAPLTLPALIGPVQYTKKQDASANTFIKYVTNQFSPSSSIDFSQLKTAASAKNLTTRAGSAAVNAYLHAKRQHAAAYSVATTNLYFLYEERQAISPDKLGLTEDQLKKLRSEIQQSSGDDKIKQISPLAVDRWMATRRLVAENYKKSWNAHIQLSSPATIQREMVQLLAEIRYELFKTRMLNEHLLVANSIIALQNASSLGASMHLNNLKRTVCRNNPGLCAPSESIGGTP